ncbi:MAG: hypothetical protein K9I99_16375 [Melioribacteraceae bacterium]|nr:hypothetical protein [Melioribacteraceae bacterium]
MRIIKLNRNTSWIKSTLILIVLFKITICAQEISQFDQWLHLNKSNSAIESNSIHTIFVDSRENIWIGTWDRGIIYVDDSGIKSISKENSNLPHNTIYKIKEDSKQNIWIATFGGGLVKYSDEQIQIFDTENSGLLHNWLYDFYIDGKDLLYIGTWGKGISIFDGSTWQNWYDENSKIPYKVPSILKDEEKLWIGSIEGLYCKIGSEIKSYADSASVLPDASVYALHKAKNNVLWIGFKQHGIGTYAESKFTYRSSDQLGFDGIYSIAEDSKGNIWFGTFGDGLVKYDGENFRILDKTNSPLTDDKIFGTFIDKYDNIWIGTLTDGLFIYNETKLKNLKSAFKILE